MRPLATKLITHATWTVVAVAMSVGVAQAADAIDGSSIRSFSITGRQVKANTLSGNHVRDASLQARDLSPAARRALAGKAGLPGVDGARGAKGDTGATGAAGPAGAKGEAGATGLTGPAGQTGPKGDPGTNGTNGTRGASAWDTIPTGETVTWSGFAHSEANEGGPRVIGQLPARPADPATTANLRLNGVDTECGGSHLAPTPTPGFICLYGIADTNVAGGTITESVSPTVRAAGGFVVDVIPADPAQETSLDFVVVYTAD